MKYWFLIIFALLPAVHAQSGGSTSSTPCRLIAGLAYSGCVTLPPTVLGGNSGVLIASGVSVSATPRPRCDEGFELVANLAMQPMCARELRKPK